MKKIFFPLFIFIGMMTISCDKSQPGQESGIQLENLDQTIIPGNDFYQFSCGGWMKNNPLTGEYARYGTFEMLGEQTKEQVRKLIDEIAASQHKEGSIPEKIKNLYLIAMDSIKLNNEGIEPVLADLENINTIRDKNHFAEVIGNLQRFQINAFWQIFTDADPMESEINIFQIYQGGLGLGERDYYLADDERTANIRNEYKKYIYDLFLLFGRDVAEAENAANAVLAIETRLAKAAYPKEKRRDPYANYNKISVDSLKVKYNHFDWTLYFSALQVSTDSLNVSQPEAIQEAIIILNQENLENIKMYLQWNVMNTAAHYLSDNIKNRSFEFYGKVLSGKETPAPRWKDAVDMLNGSLGEAVGQLYVEKYFPPEAKARMLQLVKNLQTALGERIAGLEWMGDETKQQAQEKLKTFHVKIGYPDKWMDYSSLEIKNDSYWDNYKRIAKFLKDDNLKDTDKPVDRDKWYMTPQTVNAYYNPSTNEICFPAGILQYPFFNMNADDAFNYGAIGVVIGHEMTHGFDDQGRQYDKDGNLRDWWTEEDAERFKERAEVMVKFFDNIEVAPGIHANGTFTLGENIADYGGVQVSFQAFRNMNKNNCLPEKDGFSAEQRFFIAYATVWANNIREEEIIRRTKTDPHSLGRWRVNGILPHINAWYDVFKVAPTDSMYILPENRVSIW
jgi:putative endopeptidase